MKQTVQASGAASGGGGGGSSVQTQLFMSSSATLFAVEEGKVRYYVDRYRALARKI